jgi:signal transduction histidine kinase
VLANLTSQFAFSWYGVPLVAVSTIIFCIGLFVLAQNRRSWVNISFFLICLCVNFWLYGNTLIAFSQDSEIALTFYRSITFLGVAFVAPGVYCFSVIWLKLYQEQKWLVRTILLGACSFYLVGLFSNLSFPGIQKYFWGFYPQYGPLNYGFLAFFLSVFFIAFSNFVRAYTIEKDQNRRTQIKLISIAFLISFTGSIDYIPKLISIPIYPVGYISVFFWIMTVAYTIVKYKAMDIETVIHQTILWGVTSFVVVLPLFGIFYGLQGWYQQAGPVTVALLACALFFMFHFYLKTVQPRIDHFFKRRELDLERTLLDFNNNVVHVKGLSDLVKSIVNTIRNGLYVEYVHVYLKSDKQGKLICVDEPSTSSLGISLNDPFVRWLGEQDRVTQAAYVDLDPRFEGVKEKAKGFFDRFGAEISVPLVLSGELIGIIQLSRKTNLKGFRAAELKFLSEFRRAATIAFSNSLTLAAMQENLKKWNEELEEKVKLRTLELEDAQKQLAHSEKLATIGTLSGGVAHEINNPLAAVLTNAQMLKMTITDPEDLESVQLIEEGAKRCQAIVQKLMKYARKPTGDQLIKDVSLNQVIETVLSFLRYQLEQENIKVETRFNSISTVKGVSNELEQVFTNVILNAKDAIKVAKNSGVIEIQTSERNGSVFASVKDDGVGIPADRLNKIFDPFFTDKDIGKGTGLGLSISYGIVAKHGGKIEVSSAENKGAKFIVTLPNAKKFTGKLEVSEHSDIDFKKMQGIS